MTDFRCLLNELTLEVGVEAVGCVDILVLSLVFTLLLLNLESLFFMRFTAASAISVLLSM